MNSLKVLDCTLRDGGYVNEWMFGEDSIQKVILKLKEAHIDIIECGFLTNKIDFCKDSSRFNSIENVSRYIPSKKENTFFVAMINFGEFEINMIPECDKSGLDGIRVVFHKKEKEEALVFGKKIKEKGYKVFLQPMASLGYTDEEFLSMIQEVNKIEPYAFYIVDSFGAMRRDDLLHLFYLADYNLKENIYIGFHSHNNLQLSYSHAQALSNHLTNRDLIIDSSVMGMGRGAGNLNTELFAQYLNHFHGAKYNITELLQIMDDVISPIFEKKHWGYSLPQYLSAMHNCHPNYASYLDNKNTLTFENMNDIFETMSEEKKGDFDAGYIKNLYEQYQTRKSTNSIQQQKLKAYVENKTVLVLAPGTSLSEEKEKILSIIDKDTVVVAVNFIPQNFATDFVFVSNLRRWELMRENNPRNLILTSNIQEADYADCIVNYADLLNDVESVKDNSALMLISLLISLGVKSIKLAGLDGYSAQGEANFVQPNMEFMKDSFVMEEMNRGIEQVLSEYSKLVSIKFVTTPKHIVLY